VAVTAPITLAADKKTIGLDRLNLGAFGGVSCALSAAFNVASAALTGALSAASATISGALSAASATISGMLHANGGLAVVGGATMDTATVSSIAILGTTSGGTSTITLNGGVSTSKVHVDSSGTAITGKLTANSFYCSAGIVSATGTISNTIGYTAVSPCSQVATGVYKISFAAAHPLGATYIVNLCGTDGYYIPKGNGRYASTSRHVPAKITPCCFIIS
jgi:hypothetical protein